MHSHRGLGSKHLTYWYVRASSEIELISIDCLNACAFGCVYVHCSFCLVVCVAVFASGIIAQHIYGTSIIIHSMLVTNVPKCFGCKRLLSISIVFLLWENASRVVCVSHSRCRSTGKLIKGFFFSSFSSELVHNALYHKVETDGKQRLRSSSPSTKHCFESHLWSDRIVTTQRNQEIGWLIPTLFTFDHCKSIRQISQFRFVDSKHALFSV